jgi:hypothetical protein
MADNISNIIDPSVFPEIDKLVNRLVDVEGEIAAINNKTIQLTVDLKGADNLGRLLQLTQQQQEMTDKLTNSTQEYVGAANQMSQVQQQIGTASAANVRVLVEQKQELAYVNQQIKILNQDLAAGAGNYEKNIALLTTYTQRQIQLKQEINQTSTALKDVTVNVNQTNNAFNIMGVNVESIFTRMAVRMVAMELLFSPIIAGISAAILYFTKLSDAQQLAADKLKDYNDQIKELRKNLSSLSVDSATKSDINFASAQELLDQATNTKLVMDNRIDGYNKLNSLMPQVLKNFTQEQVLRGDANKIIGESIQRYSELKGEIDATNVIYEQQTKIYERDAKIKADLDARRAKNPDVPQDERLNTRVLREMEAAYATKQKLQNLQEELGDITAPVPKEKKPKKEKAEPNDMLAMLSAEKAIYERRLQDNKDYYESTKQTYADEEKLNADNVKAAQEYGEKSFQIVNSFHIKTYKDYLEFVKQSENIQKELLSADTKYSVEEKKILDKIIADREDAQKQLAKILEQELDLKEKKQKLDDAAKTSKDKGEYAKSFQPFFDGLTGDDGFADKLKEYDNQIKEKKQELDDANIKLANARSDGNTGDIAKYEGEAGTKADDLDTLKMQREDEINQRIIDGKKEVANKTIELAQQTFAAIKQINDNQIAQEQQNLEIKSRAIQLAYQEQVDAVNASAGYQITKENQLAQMAAQNAAKQNAIQHQANELTLKKAKGDKMAAEAGIIENTALGIAKVWAEYGDIPILAAGLTAVIAGIGAAQFAAAASTPLPQFKDGGVFMGSPSGMFIAGEAGPERMTTPSGDVMFANKPGIYSAPIGTKIDTAAETAALMRFASANIGLSVDSRGELKEGRSEMTDKRIVEELKDLNETVRETAMMQRTIKNQITVNIKDRLQIY